jgi:hypothetical protein
LAASAVATGAAVSIDLRQGRSKNENDGLKAVFVGRSTHDEQVNVRAAFNKRWKH